MSKLHNRLAAKTAAIERPSTIDPVRAAEGRTMTMPGQLGAFRLEAQRYQETIQQLNAALEEAKAAGEIMIDVDLLDDSPFQTRRRINPQHVDEIAQSMDSGGQSSPITVRIVQPGRYEIIKGHTRKYAARSSDRKQLRALVVQADDRQACLDVMLDNQGRQPTEYEYGHMFRNARAKGYASTQEELAKLFACSQAKVSNCLAMLELPSEILVLLDIDPDLFGAAAGKVIATLWKEYTDEHQLVLDAVLRLADGAEQAGIRGWVEEQIAQKRRKNSAESAGGVVAPKKAPAPSPRRHTIAAPSGRECYVTVLKEKGITVHLKDLTVDPALVRERINEVLRELAQESDSHIKV